MEKEIAFFEAVGSNFDDCCHIAYMANIHISMRCVKCYNLLMFHYIELDTKKRLTKVYADNGEDFNVSIYSEDDTKRAMKLLEEHFLECKH